MEPCALYEPVFPCTDVDIIYASHMVNSPANESSGSGVGSIRGGLTFTNEQGIIRLREHDGILVTTPERVLSISFEFFMGAFQSNYTEYKFIMSCTNLNIGYRNAYQVGTAFFISAANTIYFHDYSVTPPTGVVNHAQIELIDRDGGTQVDYYLNGLLAYSGFSSNVIIVNSFTYGNSGSSSVDGWIDNLLAYKTNQTTTEFTPVDFPTTGCNIP